ncbi:MAG: phasin family protein [Magnetovibrio sp.]|nr:phasin family protein [Magnetovibrio sp.]
MSSKKKSDAATSAIDAAAENFEATADMIKDGLDAAIKATTEQAKSVQAFEGTEFPGRENFDAAIKAGEAYVAGMQELNNLFFKTAKAAVRFNTDAAKTLTECKTPEEISQAQMKLAQSSFETAVEASTTLSQAAMKVAGDVSEPLTSKLGTAYNDLVSKTAA